MSNYDDMMTYINTLEDFLGCMDTECFSEGFMKSIEAVITEWENHTGPEMKDLEAQIGVLESEVHFLEEDLDDLLSSDK